MGSMSNSNPWAPNSVALRDCSQGICSFYCPQWCYIIYSPPPPSIILDDDDHSPSSSGFEFSPLVIAVIGILASTFILLIYYTIISRLCNRHSDNNNDQIDHLHHSELGQANSGLDETIIKSITVCKYEKRDGGGGGGGGDRGGEFVVEGSDCCVCLGEFQENESLRLLPKCNHAFHLPCIDTWLKSHSTCPLCRSTITMEAEASPSSNSITINALEYQQRRRDQVVILQSCLQQQQLVVVELEGSDNNIGSSRGTQGRYN